MVIRRTYKIMGKLFFTKNYNLFRDKRPQNQMKILSAMEEYSLPINCRVDDKRIRVYFYSDQVLFAETNLPVELELLEYFIDSEVPKNIQNEKWLEALNKAAERVLSIVKYLFNFPELDEHLIQLDKTLIYHENEWKNCVNREQYEWHYGEGFFGIDNQTIPTIQKLIDHQVKPFFALKFLHRAKNEISLRDKWLYTAIASELAIKEFLYTKDSSLKNKWRENPPTIKKIFGEIIAKYLKGPLTHSKLLIKNAEIRNEIVHRPFDRKGLTAINCYKYMDAVEQTIYFLMLEIFPNDVVIKERFDNVKNNRKVDKL